MYNAGVNSVSLPTIFPTAGGSSLGVMGSAGSVPETVESPKSDKINQVDTSGKPVVWWLVLLAMLVGLMLLVRFIGGEDSKSEFASIKLSFYNVLIISLAAIVGINFFKITVNALPVPKALRTVINSV